MRHLLTAALLIAALPVGAQERLSVALDWTPNTNHVGLYVAQAKGWFDEAGLEVDILPYTDTSSGTLVAAGVAEFGILSAVSFHSQRATGADLTVVKAIVQHETGRIVFNGEREDIQRPADLDGLTYAGFGSDWEEALISTIIRNDGGTGVFDTVTLGTSAYEALANGRVDFTLEVSTWEGVNSVLLNRPQRAFRYADYGVPDQHTTFLGANGTWLSENPDTARAFVQATQRGYAFAATNPQAAADILIAETAGMLTNPALVRASMDALVTGGYLQDPGEPVGLIDTRLFTDITTFLFEAGILRGEDGKPLETLPDVTTWFSNDYLMR
ncbi:ABC transporter substrate-binding protein [Aestuariivita sp.]|jgi:ABC-type nitrate/sulfonate/bicarbonate transport system substrate-binding protein|uniref:ABC transporter substrate-binding protein n=1 Tax=Aestuariivita sp. TaxID=1872407 RepID=UPI00216C48C5|nr:ABC transporter substrate-binding protein [Aestuariivita sp.]MCE8006275.1 ABC transporter substrate-binding protein [Aestuariivita sp.]